MAQNFPSSYFEPVPRPYQNHIELTRQNLAIGYLYAPINKHGMHGISLNLDLFPVEIYKGINWVSSIGTIFIPYNNEYRTPNGGIIGTYENTAGGSVLTGFTFRQLFPVHLSIRGGALFNADVYTWNKVLGVEVEKADSIFKPYGRLQLQAYVPFSTKKPQNRKYGSYLEMNLFFNKAVTFSIGVGFFWSADKIKYNKGIQ